MENYIFEEGLGVVRSLSHSVHADDRRKKGKTINNRMLCPIKEYWRFYIIKVA